MIKWKAWKYPTLLLHFRSNFSGIALPYLGDAINNDKKINLIAIEPSACPSLTKGKYAYDFGDTGMMTPLTKMHTLGSQFVPSFHAGGLRYLKWLQL